jgi:hypothetical protein
MSSISAAGHALLVGCVDRLVGVDVSSASQHARALARARDRPRRWNGRRAAAASPGTEHCREYQMAPRATRSRPAAFRRRHFRFCPRIKNAFPTRCWRPWRPTWPWSQPRSAQSGWIRASSPALAAAFACLASDPDLRCHFAAAARRRVEQRFTLQSCVDRYEKLYRGMNEPNPRSVAEILGDDVDVMPEYAS